MTHITTGLLTVLVGVGIATAEGKAQQSLELKLTHRRVDSVGDFPGRMNTGLFVTPNSVLEYKIEYRNPAKTQLKQIELVLPIPDGLELLPDSAQPNNAKASTDGKTFHILPLTRRKTDDQGQVREEVIPITEYRFLSWSITEVSPDSSGHVTASMRVTAGKNGKATRYRLTQ
jgi:hypothetical protein